MQTKSHPPLDGALARIATRQHGVVSQAQLRALGLSPGAIKYRAGTGRLHRVHKGVYAVGHRRLTTNGRWLAAVLACGPTAVLSHRTALSLWGLRPASGPIHVTVVARGRTSTDFALHCVRALDPRDRVALDDIP